MKQPKTAAVWDSGELDEVVTMLPTGCLAMVGSLNSLLLRFFTRKTSVANLAILLPRGSNELIHKSTLNQHVIVKK